jgi:hypothetical protein
VSQTESKSQQAAGPTVALEIPSARVLADQASVIQDLEFVMDCCKRLLAELAAPNADADAAVPVALWSSALVAYARCFNGDGESGLTADDVQSLPLQGAVTTFHEWLIGERDKLLTHPANPFDAAKVGAALTPTGRRDRRVEGIAVFSTSRILIDATGIQQLGGLAASPFSYTAPKRSKRRSNPTPPCTISSPSMTPTSSISTANTTPSTRKKASCNCWMTKKNPSVSLYDPKTLSTTTTPKEPS